MAAPANFWETLFGTDPGTAGGAQVEMRLLRKRGRPFLLLPRSAKAAALSLQLYPAQTAPARIARALLRGGVGLSMPFGMENVACTVSFGDPFVRFVASLAGEKKDELPPLGILAGNPASDGQRFLLLVFDANEKPVAVVKAGLSERAKMLIEKEESFLRALDGKTTGIPRVRGVCESARLRAFALDFFPGDSPRRRHEAFIPSLLSSWVDRTRKIPIRETADWARVEGAVTATDSLWLAVRRLGDWSIHPAIQHGDFAPWNIKVSRTGAWTVLDWERGEMAGIPGWDWFHYVIQPAILVERLRVFGLIQRVEALLSSPSFKEYAALAGIEGCQRELFLGYLLHAIEVIKPSEGFGATRELAAALASRWRSV